MRDVSACTGYASQGRYECPRREQCQRHQSWLEAAVRDGLLTMGAHQEPCPYHLPRRGE